MSEPGNLVTPLTIQTPQQRGENVYLMKLGKGPMVIMNMPEEPKDCHRRPDPSTCGYYTEFEE